MATLDLWHYPRKNLATQFLRVPDIGAIASIVIYAPRRKGKTAFILNDFIPAAVKKDWVPVYVSLWDKKEDPRATLLNALTFATERAQSLLTTKVTKLSVEAKLPFIGGLKAEVDAGKTAPDARIGDAFNVLIEAARGKQIMFVADEVQTIGVRKHDSLVAELRTALDTRKESVFSVFTGSSSAGLDSMFLRNKAPFYVFSSRLDFPDMGNDFVAHIKECCDRTTGRQFELDAIGRAWELTNCTPGIMIDAMMYMVWNANSDPEQAVRRVLDDIDRKRQTDDISQLSALQKHIYDTLVENPDAKMLTKAVAQTLTVSIGAPVSVPAIANAIRSLRSKDLV